MRKKILKLFSAVLSAGLMLTSVAFAAPLDELNEIMENQMKASETLLDKQLGTKELSEAMKENGVSWNLSLFPGEGIAAMLPEETNASIGFQLDPANKQWYFETQGGFGTDPLLSLMLYGDEKQLSLRIPQFFAETVVVPAGNLRDLYVGSSLQQLLVQISPQLDVPEDRIPSIDMKFYPENAGENASDPYGLKEKAESLRNKMQVEKIEEGEETIYRTTIQTEDIIDLYRTVFDQYSNVLSAVGSMSGAGEASVEEMQESLDQMIASMEIVLGDELVMDYHVRNQLVEKITFSLHIDTKDLVEVYGENDQTQSEPVQIDEDGQALGGEAFEADMDYEILFVEPENPLKEIQYNMTLNSTDGSETAKFYMTFRTDETETTARMTLDLTVEENGNSVYEGTPCIINYDAATGAFDAIFAVASEDSSFECDLKSTFTDVVPGKSFVWNIDELSMDVSDGTQTAGGENKLGVSAIMSVAADPGVIPQMDQEVNIFTAQVNELYGLIAEIGMNVENFMAQFGGSEEVETMTEAVALDDAA